MNLEGLETVIPEKFVRIDQRDLYVGDGIVAKLIRLHKGELGGQHSHPYVHLTIVAVGKVRLWKGNKTVGIYGAGSLLRIEANSIHSFLALEDSDLYCVHNEELASAIL